MLKEFKIRKSKKFHFFNVLRVNSFSQFTGLMFKTRKTPIRLFTYRTDCKPPIHSWFVFFPFLIVWLDKNNKIIASRIVHPFNSYVLPSVPCRSFIEIPLDEKYARLISFIVGKGKHLNSKYPFS